MKIVNTTANDFEHVVSLFQKAIQLQGKKGYQVWKEIDKVGLEKDIENNLQLKIVESNNILCVFSIQFSAPLIWHKREKGDAIYLHRIVVNPKFKRQKQFEKVLIWTKKFALEKWIFRTKLTQ
ncbi:hypothetical protein [Membranihabitans marinus]|uniref:hypothetical protein n=1 Tax=Membranihabitans marinus TaxID=1227546 RepID=UPI001F1F41C8|nr:hypothetical protein [Membranihabitans marinus]